MARQLFLRKIILYIVSLVIAIVITLIILYPIVWMFMYSIRDEGEIFQWPPSFIPRKVSFEKYVLGTKFLFYFRNSLVVSLTSSVFVAFVASTAGYALSRFTFWGKKLLSFIVLGFSLFPIYVLIIPLYIIYNTLNLYDSIFGLIIVYLAVMSPFSIFLMSSFFNKVPKEIEEAAYIDGASKFQTFIQVVIPNCFNGIVAVMVFVFINCWQEFLLALSLTVSDKSRTFPVGLMSFFSQYQTDYTGVMAAAVIATIPTVAILLFLQRYFVRGMIAGALKE